MTAGKSKCYSAKQIDSPFDINGTALIQLHLNLFKKFNVVYRDGLKL